MDDDATGQHIFGEDADNYARARPDYPEAVYTRLTDVCGLGEGSAVFEVGAGTGQATGRLLDLGVASLLAVEPDDALAEVLRRRYVPASGGRLQVRHAALDAAGLPEGGFDLGVSATTFHWLDQGPSLARVMRALRPGGWWAMWWNVFGNPLAPDDFQRAAQPLFDRLHAPPAHDSTSRRHFALDEAARLRDLMQAGFTDVQHVILDWHIDMDRDAVQALAASLSPVAQLPDEARQQFLDALADLVERRFGGRVTRHFLTAQYLGRKPG